MSSLFPYLVLINDCHLMFVICYLILHTLSFCCLVVLYFRSFNIY